MPSPPASPSRFKKFRPVRPLPEAALLHSTNFLEESLFSQAFTNLTSCLTSGLSTNAPAFVPTPAVLALAATMSVHPNYTTRTADKDRVKDADSAARYLRLAADTLRPEDAGMREAFCFREASRKVAGRAQRRSGVDAGVDENGERVLAGRYAGQQSLWSCAQDFWGVVGWAFNCSVRHKERWERWKELLEVLLDVIERDLEDAAGKGEVKKCLLMSYLQTVGGGRNDRRRMMRSILADGSEKSMSEYGEIWIDETRPPKVEIDEGANNKRKLDLENGEYGDYFDDESAEEEETFTTSTRRSRSTQSKARRGPSAGSSDASASSSVSGLPGDVGSISSFGGHDALCLRQRFLALLAKVAETAPKVFGADLSDLWSLYTEFLRPLPLQVFQQFISPQKAFLSSAWQASLCEMMSRALLGISGSYGIVTRENFVSDIVGATANNSSVVDNAKVGLLVESLLRLLWSQGFLEESCEGLKEAIEDGVERREAKAAWRKKGNTGDEDARGNLRYSGERLRLLGNLICKS